LCVLSSTSYWAHPLSRGLSSRIPVGHPLPRAGSALRPCRNQVLEFSLGSMSFRVVSTCSSTDLGCCLSTIQPPAATLSEDPKEEEEESRCLDV
jgi:hypothetical protein